MPDNVKKLLIFEDNDSLRQTIKLLVNSDPRYRVVGDFDNCNDCVAAVGRLQPDMIIMDIGLPGISGVEAVRMIKEANPGVEIIMHTVFEDTERIFESLCAGASGYLLKKHSSSRLLDSLRELSLGGSPMSPGIARLVVKSFRQPMKENSYNLTARQLEILQLLVKGHSYKMIAADCNISLETVKSHLKHIYTKLHVNCGTEAVALALRDRIV